LPLIKTCNSDIIQTFKPILQESFGEYKKNLIDQNNLFNLPLILRIKNELLCQQNEGKNKSDEVSQDLINLLSNAKDSQRIKLLKEEINLHFS